MLAVILQKVSESSVLGFRAWVWQGPQQLTSYTWRTCLLQGIHGNGVLIYIDDFLYFSEKVEQHLDIMAKVFVRLLKHGIYLHPQKCVWGVSQLNYLGLLISEKKVSVSAKKIAALKEYEVTKNRADVRRFLGFAQYLAMFIPHFATGTAPVQCLLQGNEVKRKKFVWSGSCQQSFDNTIEAICTAPGLRIASTEGAYVVETDASGIGVTGYVCMKK